MGGGTVVGVVVVEGTGVGCTGKGVGDTVEGVKLYTCAKYELISEQRGRGKRIRAK